MRFDQRARVGDDPRPHLDLQIAVAQGLEGRVVEARQRRQVELGELDGAGLAAVEARDELAVGGIPLRAIERSRLDQERNPLLVAVVGDERVIEIEYRENVGAHREMIMERYNDGWSEPPL